MAKATGGVGTTPEMARLQDALDALPSLVPALRMIPELRIPLLDACVSAGISVPVATRRALGV